MRCQAFRQTANIFLHERRNSLSGPIMSKLRPPQRASHWKVSLPCCARLLYYPKELFAPFIKHIPSLALYKVGKNTIFVPRLKFAHTPSDHSAHNHRRPINQRHQRTRNQADALQWLLFDVEAPVHQIEESVKPRSSSNYESRYGWQKCDKNGCPSQPY